MTQDHYLPYWLAALHLPGIGPRTIMRWLEYFHQIDELFRASPLDLQAAGLTSAQIRALQAPDWRSVEKALAFSAAEGCALVSLSDPDYPAFLREISDPPLVLFVRGDPVILSLPQIAIVGARNASAAGVSHAGQFARYLAAAGYVITSGLALGIDGASHRGALSVSGKTIAVMGTGLNQIYPSAHRALADEIAANGGAVVSEFPLDVGPRAMNFPRRNRIIGGLSQGVLVVEAAVKSGSLITARYALEQGREVFAIPGSIDHPLARGCHYLIKQGAKLVEKADDILEELGAHQQPQHVMPVHAQAAIDPALPADCRALLELIDYAVTSMDMIVLRSRLTAGEVSSMLLLLELYGCIESVSGGYRRTAVN